jgi:hypothetical protein
MYQFSRSIYRELAPRIQGDELARARARRHILEASEATLERLASDRRYFAKPSSKLFNEIRGHFPLSEQAQVYRVVALSMGLATTFLDSLPAHLTVDGQRRDCPASTRKGTPCKREPRSGKEYCPSHMHLEDGAETRDLELPLRASSA